MRDEEYSRSVSLLYIRHIHWFVRVTKLLQPSEFPAVLQGPLVWLLSATSFCSSIFTVKAFRFQVLLYSVQPPLLRMATDRFPPGSYWRAVFVIEFSAPLVTGPYHLKRFYRIFSVIVATTICFLI